MPAQLAPRSIPTILFGAICVMCWVSCAASNAEIRTARNAEYQMDLATAYEQTRISVAKLYPDLLEDSENGLVQTAWHRVDSSGPSMGANGTLSASAPKRFYIRFRVAVVGSNPYQVRVEGEASEWSPGLTPMKLKKAEEPPWLQGRTDALQLAIHRRLKKYAASEGQAPQPHQELSPPEEGASAEPPSTEIQKATVHVRATAPGIAVAVRADEGEIVALDGTTWRKVCIAPCAFRIMSGDQEVMIGGNGVPTKSKLSLEPGNSVYLVAKPRSEVLAMGGGILALAGLTGIFVGTGAMALTDLDLSLTVGIAIGGVGGLGLGLGMMALSDSSLDVESAPKSARASKAISVSGRF